jgi:hypothetical protein
VEKELCERIMGRRNKKGFEDCGKIYKGVKGKK